MPNRWPIANGNWSNAAIWSGSIIPTASDDVFLNNRVITLDQNIIVSSIRTVATGSAVAGGRIEIYNNFNISASLIRNTAQPTTLILNYGTGSITITSALNSSSGNEDLCLNNVNNGTVNIVGNVFGRTGTGGTTPALGTVVNSSNGIINVIGNIRHDVASAGSGCTAVYNLLNGVINITGNVLAGSSNGAGNVTAIANVSTGIINVTGNIIGGTTAGGIVSQAIGNSSIGQVNVTGNVTANLWPAITSTTAGIINVIGQCIASTASNAVSSTSTTATNIFSGPLINSGSKNSIYCYNVQMYDDVTTRYTIGVSGSTNTISLLSPDQVTGVPSGSDVRAGIIYGPGNELTGSMNVPHPNSVSIGVAVDQTTGSALVKPEDLWNMAITSLTASNSIGQRLANASTSASMAAIINAFTV
jgi:hypothetical protein